ncbi:MAG: M48 family metallopeptidase [Pseudomonadota bacterium]
MARAATGSYETPPLAASFFDGESAERRPVRIEVRPKELVIRQKDSTLLARWPLEDVRERRDHGFPSALVLSCLNGEARAIAESAQSVETLRARCPNLKRSTVTRPEVRRALGWSGAAAAAFAALYFLILPGIATRLADSLPPEKEAAFGEAVVGQVEALFASGDRASPFCTNDEGLAALETMVARLSDGGPLEGQLHVRVLRSDVINAFAVPGNKIVIFSGLIEAAKTPEEVAAVLAHEMGHVAARDPLRAALKSIGTAGLLSMLFGDISGGTVVGAMTEQVVSARYSQDLERRADAYAHKLLDERGISPDALALMFERLRAEYGNGDGVVAVFLSHPRLSERIAAARAEAAASTGPHPSVLTGSEWSALRNICDA